MFFPKPHFIVDKKRRRTKGASCNCPFSICDELGLYRRRTASLNESLSIELRFGQRRHEDGGIIEFSNIEFSGNGISGSIAIEITGSGKEGGSSRMS